jgi:DNA/RNA endonuclease G (NUC1)
LSVTALAATGFAQAPKPPATSKPAPNNLTLSYSHDGWQTSPRDIIQKWRAYTVSFDGDDDDNGDGKPDRWAIPHWVAYQVKRHAPLPKGPDRPSPWITDLDLFAKGIVPADESYHYPATMKKRPPYDRGHMCPKFTAWRMGPEADWNTHTLVNACPQHSELNEGIWENLERKVDAWADEYKSVWVVTGPIVSGNKPKRWLGQKGEIPVAIPDAFFKIVIKVSATPKRPDVLAFIYPNKSIDRKATNHEKYLTSVNAIEAKTGLDFLLKLSEADQAIVESAKATALWK